MAMKTRIYLDTTVPSVFLDDRTPDRQELTRDFWNHRMNDFEPVISDVVIKEIRDTPDVAKLEAMEKLVINFPVLALDPEARQLRRQYLRQGVFSEKYRADANHVAIAAVNRIGYILSWNFRHLVKVRTRREVNLVNAAWGYEPIEIITPPEL
jgi:hypothetical protein